MVAPDQKQAARRPILTAGKLVVATRRGYWGTQIKDPNGSASEQAPFRVPQDAEASWFKPAPEAKASETDETDIG